MLDVDDTPEAHPAPVRKLLQSEVLRLSQLAQVHAKSMKGGVWMIRC